jgi:hypothetical protein
VRRAESVGWVGAAGGDCGLEEEKEEEDAGRDAPQTAWGKMPQPLRPVNGLGQDAPATTPRERSGAGRASHDAPGTAWQEALDAASLGRIGGGPKTRWDILGWEAGSNFG